MIDKSMVPVNRTAANVIKRGTHFYVESKNERVYDIDPMFKDMTGRARLISKASFKDYTGLRMGRLTVICFIGQGRTAGGHAKKGKWKCRCDCGSHTVKKTPAINKFIRNGLGSGLSTLMCDKCKQVEILKRKNKK